MTSSNQHLILILGLLTLTFFSACTSFTNEEPVADDNTLAPPTNTTELKKAGSNEVFETALKDYFVKLLANQANQPRLGFADTAEFTTAPAAGAADTTSAAPNTSSGTNLIEQGVDEADLVKSDDSHIYIVKQGQYAYAQLDVAVNSSVARVVSDEPMFAPGTPVYSEPWEIRIMQKNANAVGAAEVAVITLPEHTNYVKGIYLRNANNTGTNKRLIVVASVASTNVAYPYNYEHSLVLNYDVSVATAPSLLWKFEMQGYSSASRMIGNQLYLVSQKNIWIPGLIEAANSELDRRSNQTIIDNIVSSSILPTTWIDDVATPMVLPGDCFIPTESSDASVYAPNLVTIAALTIDDLNNSKFACTFDASQEVYVSTESIYLTRGEFFYFLDPVADIGLPRNNTIIHKFDIRDAALNYKSSARVPGLTGWGSQSFFRFSEKDQKLRVITSQYKDNRWGEQEHKLYILADSNGGSLTGLQIISQLPNSAHPEPIGKPGENIYSVRFFNDSAYVVTFQKVDPLYVINLADALNPFIEGELEIPGFSDYLHPIGDNYLLGVGKNAIVENNTAWYQGIKIGLFNISDKTNPTLINSVEIGKRGSNSLVAWDHHAFSILDLGDGRQRISIPMNVHDGEPYLYNRLPTAATHYAWSYSGTQLLTINQNVESTAGATLVNDGFLKIAQADTGSTLRYMYLQSPRSIITDNQIYFVNNSDLWSAEWLAPEQVTGPQ
ncbi:MAG: beta-propeller domain-containing protein [Gammaproteobacteria bacterium]|nr:beta-propeller domain-containing protein [Gammaproteobacteria bacterium]